MKRLKRPLILAVSLLLLLLIQVQAQQQTATWNYPVRPGTTAWSSLTSYEERLAAYNIPDAVLKKVSTPELVKICLQYPEWRLVNTRNSLQLGYDYLKTIFNGFGELERRPGAGSEIVKVYQTLNPRRVESYGTLLEKGNYMMEITYIELLLAQPSIIGSVLDKKSFASLCIANYETKKGLMSEYGVYGLTTSALILGRTLEVQRSTALQNAKISRNAIGAFLASSQIGGDVASLDAIVALSKESIGQK
jgi:hypothetical protein